MLYAPELHEPLTERRWSDAWARGAIAEIVADADRHYDHDSLWPADEWDAFGASLPLVELYAGAAGMAGSRA